MAHQPTIQSFGIPNIGTPAGVPASYCNGVQISVSQWDVTCLFFHAVPVPVEQPGQEALSERRLVQAVVMSPQHAKALAGLLDRNVQAWEQQNGEIRLPDDVYSESTVPAPEAPPTESEGGS